MKKVILSAIMATLLITSSFASGNKKVNSTITENFKKQFKTADDVSWTVKNDFVKASFEKDGKAQVAFYNFNGELLSTSTPINIDDLPAAIKRAFAKKYDAYVVKEAVKMENDEETAYYLSVENDEETLILKANNNNLSIFKVTKK